MKKISIPNIIIISKWNTLHLHAHPPVCIYNTADCTQHSKCDNRKANASSTKKNHSKWHILLTRARTNKHFKVKWKKYSSHKGQETVKLRDTLLILQAISIYEIHFMYCNYCSCVISQKCKSPFQLVYCCPRVHFSIQSKLFILLLVDF
jgi:hypothetical protein